MINLNFYCSSPLTTPNSKINCSESDVCLLLSRLLCCEVRSHSVVSNSLQPHELQHTRLLCPWGFSRQEYWSGLPCTPSGDLPNPGIEPRSPALQVDSLLTDPPDRGGLISGSGKLKNPHRTPMGKHQVVGGIRKNQNKVQRYFPSRSK